MIEPSEVQAIQSLSAVIDESEKRVHITKACYKAQVHLTRKLQKQAELCKEKCNFIRNANQNMQSEICQAQQEIQSSFNSYNTVKTANVDLRKDLLIAQEKKLQLTEKVEQAEKKYEKLWSECKARYESLPFVQKLTKAKDEAENIRHKINKLDYEEKACLREIETKRQFCLNLDRKRTVEMAHFIVIEMPRNISAIKEKSVAMQDLTNKLKEAKENGNTEPKLKATIDPSKTAWHLAVTENEDYHSIMPKLQLSNFDFDNSIAKLNKLKLKRVDSFNKSPEKHQVQVNIETHETTKKIKTEEYISSFFNKPSFEFEESKPRNYAKMKLINILDDIKIDKNAAHKMLTKLNLDTLQPVDSISEDKKNTATNTATNKVLKTKEKKPIESDEIEEIDMSGSNIENLLIPPSPFLDMTSEIQQQIEGSPKENPNETLVTASTLNEEVKLFSGDAKSSQEGVSKKRVSFDLPTTTIETNMIDHADQNANDYPEKTEDVTTTNNTLLDVSAASDEGFSRIKDMIMKKHNLDLSPQFVYAKNTMAPLNKRDSNDVITSKFFHHTDNKSKQDTTPNVVVDNKQVVDIVEAPVNLKINDASSHKLKGEDNPTAENIEVEADFVSSPKKPKLSENETEKCVSGFPFGFGSQLLTNDSADVSMNTTGLEDGDADFPQCYDTSLLLSPKATSPIPSTIDNQEVLSQEVPNFLSGLRKSGFSFFGCTNSDPKPSTSAQNQGSSSFNFNFGGGDKKKGSLFSMFQ